MYKLALCANSWMGLGLYVMVFGVVVTLLVEFIQKLEYCFSPFFLSLHCQSAAGDDIFKRKYPCVMKPYWSTTTSCSTDNCLSKCLPLCLSFGLFQYVMNVTMICWIWYTQRHCTDEAITTNIVHCCIEYRNADIHEQSSILITRSLIIRCCTWRCNGKCITQIRLWAHNWDFQNKNNRVIRRLNCISALASD